ncbi:trihelix transcription factor GTL1 isoform X1 [Carya illinoinensis]|uniref:trihelix transcription factor GTL1 isoform X1 n=1 Tax=Carya illinoinensis TaxID=32201 RepID=UPI001C71A820|nr:trihelix transcription factor GTL1 isoform X1 [Carya illinoinensis]
MEPFTGDRGVPDPEEAFPDHVTPFPDTMDLIYDHQTAAVHSPELVAHLQNLPPQKLRPIRCFNFRSPEKLEETQGRFSPEEPEEEVALGSVNGPVAEVPGECFVHPMKVEVGEAFEIGKGSLTSDDPERFGSVTGWGEWGPNCVDEDVESGTSSSSSDDDSTANIKEPMNRKRKGKSSGKLEHFLESLVNKVMEKQEQMHKQLIEIIEKREKERIIREEAWKQQEMERMKREEEMRALQTSRSLALISFIQNLSGQEFPLPQPVNTQCKEEDGSEIGMEPDIKCDPNGKRWPEAEVQALITLRAALEHKSCLTGSKRSMWEEISVGMWGMGYNRTAKKCKEKWENINKYFRRSMESGKKHSANGKTCHYFHELNMLYGNGLMDPGLLVKITDSETEAKSENE